MENKKLRVILIFILFIFVLCIANIMNKNKKKNIDNNINIYEPKNPNVDNIKIDNTLKIPMLKHKNIKKFDIQNDKINNIILNRNMSNEDIGTLTFDDDKYKEFYYENIKVRKNLNTILSIKILNNFEGNILNDINLYTSFIEIEDKLGEPNFKSDEILYYLSENYDIAFSKIKDKNYDEKIREITIYFTDNNKSFDETLIKRIVEFQENEEKLNKNILKYSEYTSKKNEQNNQIRKLISDITKYDPAYFKYNYNSNLVQLRYINYGVDCILTGDYTDKKNGIYFYENFFRNEENEYVKTLITNNSNNSSIIKIMDTALGLYEETMYISDMKYMLEKSLKNESKTELVYFEKNNTNESKYKNARYISIDRKNKNIMLNDGFVDNIFLTKEYIIYVVQDKKIYILNKKTSESTQIFELKENEKINFIDFKNGILYINNDKLLIEK